MILYQRLKRWHGGGGNQKARRRFPDVAFYDFEKAWEAWTLTQNIKSIFGWCPLPTSGGLFDQSEKLLSDLVKISNASYNITEEMRENNAGK